MQNAAFDEDGYESSDVDEELYERTVTGIRLQSRLSPKNARRIRAVRKSIDKALASGRLAYRIPGWQWELQHLMIIRSQAPQRRREAREAIKELNKNMDEKRARKRARVIRKAAKALATLRVKRVLNENLAGIKAKLWFPGSKLETKHRMQFTGEFEGNEVVVIE